MSGVLVSLTKSLHLSLKVRCDDSSASKTENLSLQHKLGHRQQPLQLFVLGVLVFRIRTGASLVTPINSDMLTIPSLI